MERESARELQRQIAKEAVALLSLGAAAGEVNLHGQAVRLIGKAWELPEEVTNEHLSLIDQEQEVMAKLARGEEADHILKEEHVLCSWSGLETLEAVEDLFKTSLRLDSFEERESLYQMAMELIGSQNLLDWLSTPTAQDPPPDTEDSRPEEQIAG